MTAPDLVRHPVWTMPGVDAVPTMRLVTTPNREAPSRPPRSGSLLTNLLVGFALLVWVGIFIAFLLVSLGPHS